MLFDPSRYPDNPEALAPCRAADVFPGAPFPEEALAGLWLRFDRLDESHRISQRLETPEAAFWHGIMHRREPDPANAAYWFRRVGRHAVFPELRDAAAAAGFDTGAAWDPFAWIEFWERARRKPASPEHAVAAEVQRLEWEILFDWCVRPR